MYETLRRHVFEALLARLGPALAPAPVNVTTGAARNTQRPSQGGQLSVQPRFSKNG